MVVIINKDKIIKVYLIGMLLSIPFLFVNAGLWTLLWIVVGVYIYTTFQKAEERLQRSFPVCPFCGSNNIFSEVGMSIYDTVTCADCGAQWKIYVTSTGNLKWAKLTTPSNNGGAELVGQKKSPEFWISLSRQRHPDLWKIKPVEANSSTDSEVGVISEKLEEIKSNIEEYITEGDAAYIKGRYTAATNLYFKALVGICDYFIIKERGIKPKNHDERFEILKNHSPPLYRIVSKFFTLYRKAYSEKISQKECEELRGTVLSLKNSIIK